MMKWAGETHFTEDLIVFRGRSFENKLHAMPGTVLAMSHDGHSVVLNEKGVPVGGAACLIDPMTPHMIAAERSVTITFLSPLRCLVEEFVIAQCQDGFAPLDRALFPDPTCETLTAFANQIQQVLLPEKNAIDRRLQAALDLLGREPGVLTVAEVAESVGVSASRLRALAQRELGSSLARWLTWKKLEHAVKGVAQGEAFAQSALSAGFADQAHFTNAMRRLLGTAPSEIGAVRIHP